MHLLATRLMGQKSAGQVQSVSAIFGQLSSQTTTLAESPLQFRIGMWPVQSDDESEIAMGVANLLAYLLERWPSIRVYRLLAPIEEGTNDFTWTAHDSQFGVDDWELDGLDENAAIWGEYSRNGGHVSLTLNVENDFADDSEQIFKKTWGAENLSHLVTILPQIAADIAEELNAGRPNPIVPLYDTTASWDISALEKTIKTVFAWERSVYFTLAGKSWSEQEISADFLQLLSLAEELNKGLGAWIVANAAVRLLSRLYQPLFNPFPDYILKLESKLFAEPEYAVTIAVALFRAGESVSAFYILEKAVEDTPQNVAVWLALAEIFWLGGEQGAALNAYQSAIQSRISSPFLYSRYADLLLAFDASNIAITPGAQRTSASGRSFTEQYVLIDEQKTGDDGLLQEAVAANLEALKLEPTNLELRAHVVLNLLDLEDERLWAEFEQLVQSDPSGNFVRNAIDGMYALQDLSDGIKILSDAVVSHPDRVDLHLNLAMIYLLAEEIDSALGELDLATNLAKSDPQTVADIERLTLTAEDPNFEQQLGEITDLVNAGGELSEENMDFLEEAMEKAPSFADLYIILANAYLHFDEVSDALDVLLDGQTALPDNPQVATNLGKALWRAGENELAFECLNKGLVKNKNYVPLLALTGQFLFEDGQDEEAKAFLSRAEALDSQDPVLREVRIAIANSLDYDR
ncbi:MAG: tetratricopeptide repeat protein [Chloroflexota bacterium]